LAYGAVTSYAFWLYAFGPALALLQQQLHFSYTMLGGYSALWSGGAAVAGAGFARTARHLRRGPLLWSSALLAALGAGLFTLTHTVALTLVGAAVMGFAGTTLLTVTQAILSDRHGRQRDRALTEANIGAGACAVLAPLLLGPLAGTSVGWRAAFALPVVALLGLFLRFRQRPLPAASVVETPSASRRLPRASRLFAILVAGGMALEFCLVYFGVTFLATTGLSTATATTAISSYYLGIFVGRIGGAVLTRRADQTTVLLYGSLGVTVAGFLAFWLTGAPTLAVAGLFVCGLGIANLYPLSLALTIGAAEGQEDQANARTQLIGGLLVIAAPYLLGALADSVGLTAAFTIEPVLAGACVLLLLGGLAAERNASVG
jgi:MFS family permease